MEFLRAASALVLMANLTGCLGTSPQEREPSVQGSYDDGDEEHRPGQPCLLCHSSGHFLTPPGGRLWEVAGTVYGFVDDTENEGLEGVLVELVDADGYEFSARTNATGNFMFEVPSKEADEDLGKGRVVLAQKPVFPLSVSISRGEDKKTMKTKIWREGSCSHCHGEGLGVDSVGRVPLFEASTR